MPRRQPMHNLIHTPSLRVRLACLDITDVGRRFAKHQSHRPNNTSSFLTGGNFSWKDRSVRRPFLASYNRLYFNITSSLHDMAVAHTTPSVDFAALVSDPEATALSDNLAGGRIPYFRLSGSCHRQIRPPTIPAHGSIAPFTSRNDRRTASRRSRADFILGYTTSGNDFMRDWPVGNDGASSPGATEDPAIYDLSSRGAEDCAVEMS